MIKYEIDEKTAQLAKELNSFDDYKTNSATTEYESYLNKFENNVKTLIEQHSENLNEDALKLIEYYKNQYSKKLAFAINKSNSIEARMPSWMITGGGNFNIRKKEKQNRARESFWSEYGSLFDENNYYFKKIENIITNKTIYSDDALAIEKLEAKIESLKELQEKMKAVNYYYRKNKKLEGCELLTSEELRKIKINMEIHTWDNAPFAQYELTNNNQNIHRLEDRLSTLKKLKERASQQTENKYIQIEGLKVVEDGTDMRIRLIFDEIPNENIRSKLKYHGFKWSPKNNAWQRQLTTNGIYSTKKLLEELKENN